MTRNIPRLLLMGALLFPATLYALGLGEIHLNSALSQPFDAEVELLSATPEELSTLKVSLASADSFDRAGLERAQYLTGFVFKVVPAGNGRSVIRITSTRAISEPVVSLLLEASWGNGRVQREYTVFLDPPVFVPVQPAPAVVEEPRTVAPPPTDQSRTQGVIERPAEPTPAVETIAVPAPLPTPPPTAEAAPTPAPIPAEPPPTTAAVPPTAEVAAPEPMPEPPPAPETVPAPMSADTYDVQRNDSLWKIATRLRPGAPQSINQTMIALYRANPSAFAGNINRLRAGAVLRVPPPDEIEAVDTQSATAEVTRQYNEWRPEAAAVAEDREHLRLVTPQEPAAPVESAAQVAAAERAKKAEAETARAEQVKAQEAERVAAAAKKMAEEADAKRLLDLKNAELARMQREREARAAAEAVAAKAAQATPEPAPAEPIAAEPVADVAPAPAEPAEAAPAETEPVPAPVVPAEPSFTDTLAALPWTMIAGGFGILALLGGWFVYSRRRQEHIGPSIHFPMPEAGVPTMTQGDFDAAMAEPTKTRSRAQGPAFDSGVMDEPESIPEAEGTKPLHGGAPPEEFAQPAARVSRSADDTLSSETAVHVDQQDAVAEADFHMAYGLYDQAADLVKIAIDREPKRRDLKLKLLEIYFVWGNKELFLDTARDLHGARAQAPTGEWDKILIMGKQIAPDDALFRGGAVASSSAGDMLDVNLEGGENRVDFDLFSAPEAGETESASLDFEIGNTGSRAKPSSHLDFLLDDSGAAQMADDDTREMDTNARTQETPTIESPVLGRDDREPTVEMNFGDHTAEQTAELSIDDLGLDVSALEGTGSLERTSALIGARADTLRGRDEDIGDDDMTRIAPAALLPPKGQPAASSLEPTMEMPQVKLDFPRAKSGNGHDQSDLGDGEEVGVSTIYLEQMESPAGDVVETLGPRTDETAHMLSPSELDLDLAQLGETDASDEDTIRTKARKRSDDATAEMPAIRSRPDTAATAEQPRPKIDRSDMLVATSELPEMEPVTMSEVGTKLDLARAYMDMGDPDGARSILEEVLGEGNSGQRAEAQRLLDSLR